MKTFKKVGLWLWNNIRILTTVILIVLCTVILIKPEQPLPSNYVWQATFNLESVPNGLVIWKHGVPGTEMAFIHSDSSTRYEYFDIGILTKNNVVHKIRIPFYTLSMFRLGHPTNYRRESNDKNAPLPKNNQSPKNKNDKNT